MSAAVCGVCQSAPPMRSWAEVPDDARALYVGTTTAPTLCYRCWYVGNRSPARLAGRQTQHALDALVRPAAAFVRWPFASLDALTGPMAPGSVHYVAAASGGGKTTFVTSVIRAWIGAGIRVAVLPLESEPWAWRIHMACVTANVPPGDMLSGELQIRAEAGDPYALAALDAVRDELRAMQRHARDTGRLAVHPDRHVSAHKLAAVCTAAATHGAQLVVIDHVDHIGPDEDEDATRNALAESQRVNMALLSLAKSHKLVVIAMSQLNANRMRGARDRLAKYAAPQASDLYLHTFKEHNAASILGLFRPLAPDADPDALTKARAGDVEPQTVLAPGVMGVAAVKLRHYGQREGQRCYLAVDRGAARERTADEIRDWQSGTAGIRTGDDRRPEPALRLAR